MAGLLPWTFVFLDIPPCTLHETIDIIDSWLLWDLDGYYGTWMVTMGGVDCHGVGWLLYGCWLVAM